MSGQYRIWSDVQELVNKLTTDIYKTKHSASFLRKHAMKEAYASEEYKKAAADFKKWKADNMDEWKKLQDKATAAKKTNPKKPRKSKK